METANASQTAERFHELFGGPLQTEAPHDERSARRFRQRVATLDRAFLGITVFCVLQSLYYTWAWGFDTASYRLIFDGLGFGLLVGVVATPILLLLTLYPKKRVRRTAVAGVLFASYATGYGLWCFSMLIAWGLAGKVAAIAGAAALGIGVVPVAIVGALLHGELLLAGGIVSIAALSVLLRRFAMKRID